MSIARRSDEFYMREALKQARRALLKAETPIGAVIVKDGSILARGYNLRESKQDATLHAELIAIRKACKKVGSWRLTGCQLYVTLEPCAMCAGAIVLSRLDRVVFGAYDPKAGSCGSVMDILTHPSLNHHPQVTAGVLTEACGKILSDFFHELRKEHRTRAAKDNP